MAQRYHLPAISYNRAFAEAGGLVGYGNDIADNYRHAAAYADRILKGEKPSEHPVQSDKRQFWGRRGLAYNRD